MTGSFKGAWTHRRWRWLLGSFAISSLGDYFYFIALVVFLIDSTGSASWIAAAAVARLLAYALLGPLGGVIADRFDRRRLMVLLDLVRAGLMVILAMVAWADGPPAIAVGLTVLNAIASTPYRPAIVAATPSLVDEDNLAAANAAESIVGQVAVFLGPAIGAMVVVGAGTGAAFLTNGITFIVSAALLVRIGSVGGGRAGAQNHEHVKADSVAAQVVEGLRTIRAQPGLISLIVFASAVVFLYGFEQVVHVLVATDRLDMSASGVGVLGAAIGVGGLIVAPFTAKLGGGPSAGWLLAASGVLMGLPMVLLAVISSPAVAIVALMFEGAGAIGFEVLFITLLQRATPTDALARVFGLQDSITAVAQLLGSLMAPILIAAVALEASLWIGGGIMVGTALVLAVPLNRLAVSVDAERRGFAPIADRLRGLDIFAEAPQAAIERLARSAQPRSLPAGETLFHEGDAADELFVIVSGTVIVLRAPVGEIDRMGPGDWFGEVGLLRGAPRNATIAADDDVELLSIPGPVFLEALTAFDTLPDPLRRTLSWRVPTAPTDSARMQE